MMINIGIIYFTSTDITGQLVRACSKAIVDAGANVLLQRIENTDIVNGRYRKNSTFIELEKCDAIVFASPTYMGGPAAQFKAFADASSPVYSKQGWSEKIAAGITSGSALNGDQSSTLSYFSILASQHGMCWLGLSSVSNLEGEKEINRLGCQLGVVAQSTTASVNEVDIQTAKSLGARIVNRLSLSMRYAEAGERLG